MAFILESVEIRRLWPAYNSSQKRFTPNFGLYLYEDGRGYMRLAIDKKKKNLTPVYTFNLLVEGHRLVKRMIDEFGLCPKLCFIQTDDAACIGVVADTCKGACEQREHAIEYNKRVQRALDFLDENLPTFALVDEGHRAVEQSCILIEKGRFYGMGYLPEDCAVTDMDSLKTYLTRYPENDYIRGLVYQHIEQFPHKKRAVAHTK
jgi:DNA polymerase-3 subunit epsilon